MVCMLTKLCTLVRVLWTSSFLIYFLSRRAWHFFCICPNFNIVLILLLLFCSSRVVYLYAFFCLDFSVRCSGRKTIQFIWLSSWYLIHVKLGNQDMWLIMAISREFSDVFLILLGVFSCFILHLIWISLFPFAWHMPSVEYCTYHKFSFCSCVLFEIICNWLFVLCGASAYVKHLQSLLVVEEEDITGMQGLKEFELLGVRSIRRKAKRPQETTFASLTAQNQEFPL